MKKNQFLFRKGKKKSRIESECISRKNHERVCKKTKKTKRRREKKKSRVSMGRVRKKRRVKRIGSLKCLRAVFVGVGGRGRGVEEVRPGRTRGSRRWPGLGASEGRRTRSGAVPDQDRSFGEIGNDE